MEPIAEGERWAYRKASLPLEEVTVLKVVSQSGNRKVRIQFEDGANAGEIAWVGRLMLKAPWDQRAEFLNREHRWAVAKACTCNVPQSHLDAAALVVTETVEVAMASDQGNGLLKVPDLPRLAAYVDVPTSELLGDAGFEEDGFTYLPWPAMQLVAIARSRADSLVVLDMVQQDAHYWNNLEIQLGSKYILKRWVTVPEGPPSRDYEIQKLAWDTIRGWCGEDAMDKWSEVDRVRRDNARLADLLERALQALERAGGKYYAARFRGEAGRAFGKTPDWIKNLEL